jgi:hypothetical protein
LYIKKCPVNFSWVRRGKRMTSSSYSMEKVWRHRVTPWKTYDVIELLHGKRMTSSNYTVENVWHHWVTPWETFDVNKVQVHSIGDLFNLACHCQYTNKVTASLKLTCTGTFIYVPRSKRLVCHQCTFLSITIGVKLQV